MTDIEETIKPKSDQLNADDLIMNNKIITITKVDVDIKREQQPTWIYYEGGDGNKKPYKPSKGMRRTIAYAWGKYKENYIGKSLELYRDPDISYRKQKNVGGIKIKNMSDIKEPFSIPLVVGRGRRVIHHVGVLKLSNDRLDELRKIASEQEDFAKWASTLSEDDKKLARIIYKEMKKHDK